VTSNENSKGDNSVMILEPVRAHFLARRLSAAAAIISTSVLLGLAGCSNPAPAHQPPPSGASAVDHSGGALPGCRCKPPPVTVDAAYKSAVETSVARSLHRTAAKVRAEFRANPGSGLENLAKPLGLAEDQLARIVLSGLDDAANAASRSGRWTARQAQAEKMYWAKVSDTDLVTGVSSWFVSG
jgi:hypothetical protein